MSNTGRPCAQAGPLLSAFGRGRRHAAGHTGTLAEQRTSRVSPASSKAQVAGSGTAGPAICMSSSSQQPPWLKSNLRSSLWPVATVLSVNWP